MSATRRKWLVLATVSSLMLAIGVFFSAQILANRDATRRTLTVASLKKLALALHFYHDDKGTLPPAAVTDRAGKPLLSWRVLLLPYLEQRELFELFRLDEPWDSAHNLKLLDRMPTVYLPYRDAPITPGHTFYQAIVGPGTPFVPGKPLTFDDLKGRTSRLLLFVEASSSVPWTKPDDLVYEPEGALPAFGSVHRDGNFRAAMADGQVTRFQIADTEKIRAAITGEAR